MSWVVRKRNSRSFTRMAAACVALVVLTGAAPGCSASGTSAGKSSTTVGSRWIDPGQRIELASGLSLAMPNAVHLGQVLIFPSDHEEGRIDDVLFGPTPPREVAHVSVGSYRNTEACPRLAGFLRHGRVIARSAYGAIVVDKDLRAPGSAWSEIHRVWNGLSIQGAALPQYRES